MKNLNLSLRELCDTLSNDTILKTEVLKTKTKVFYSKPKKTVVEDLFRQTDYIR